MVPEEDERKALHIIDGPPPLTLDTEKYFPAAARGCTASPARERKVFAKPSERGSTLSRALLERLDAESPEAWLPQTGLSLTDMVRAEQNPSARELLSKLVPEALRNERLVKRSEQPNLFWNLCLRLFCWFPVRKPRPRANSARPLD